MTTENQKKASFRLGKKFTLSEIDRIHNHLSRITNSLVSAREMIEASTDADDIENRVRFLIGDLEDVNFRPSKLITSITTFNKLTPFDMEDVQ